jgi:hypothetical protein
MAFSRSVVYHHCGKKSTLPPSYSTSTAVMGRGPSMYHFKDSNSSITFRIVSTHVENDCNMLIAISELFHAYF